MVSENTILKALNHPVRMKIIRWLLNGPSCVNFSNKAIGISQPNLSQHLKVLKDSDLVCSKKVKTKRCYSLKDPEKLKQMLKLIEELTMEK